MSNINNKTIGIIGAGPSALFFLKHLIASRVRPKKIFIFEKNSSLGKGMPYSSAGANEAHVANISANEIPALETDFEDFVKNHSFEGFGDYLNDGDIDHNQVVPRLLLGEYFQHEFDVYLQMVKNAGIEVLPFTNTEVSDVRINADDSYTIVKDRADEFNVDIVLMSIGHQFIKTLEGKHKGWYDSPYPPSKFDHFTNHPIAIRGASLTAVDAIKTLSRRNGFFTRGDGNRLKYALYPESENFKIHLYSLSGLMPPLKFKSEVDAYRAHWKMTDEEILEYKRMNGGFVDLGQIFEEKVKPIVQKVDPKFFKEIENLNIEGFADKMMKVIKELDSFKFFEAEYHETEELIKRHEITVYVKVLTSLSYFIKLSTTHVCAEDMIRLNNIIFPLVTIINSSLPVSSYHEIIAMYEADAISLCSVDRNSSVEPLEGEGVVYSYYDDNGVLKKPTYRTFVDATGQSTMSFDDLLFEGLKEKRAVSTGYLSFRNPESAIELLEIGDKMIKKGDEDYFLLVSGLNINDNFQALDAEGNARKNLYIMSAAYIDGLSPNHSGLNFCNSAAERIVQSFISNY